MMEFRNAQGLRLEDYFHYQFTHGLFLQLIGALIGLLIKNNRGSSHL